MFSEKQFTTAQTATIAHLDATGSVVRKPNEDLDKRAFYWALVIDKEKTTISILEMLT